MNKLIIQQTQQWLEDIVIGLNFCPFAKKVFNNGTIYYYVDTSTKIEDCLYKLIQQFKKLDEQAEVETSLIIYPENFESFNDYLDYLYLADQLLEKEGYEGIYQLASFHPDYCFQGSKAGDAENYTNRSPYPMLHLLREQRLEEALQQYPEPENIPQQNIATAQNKGVEYFAKYLKSLKKEA